MNRGVVPFLARTHVGAAVGEVVGVHGVRSAFVEGDARRRVQRRHVGDDSRLQLQRITMSLSPRLCSPHAAQMGSLTQCFAVMLVCAQHICEAPGDSSPGKP